MNRMTKAGFLLAAGLALYACSKPAEIVVKDTSVGPITVTAPFDVGAVGKLLSGRKVEAAISSALQPGEHVIRVSDGDTVLMELYPNALGKTIETALVLDASILDDKGVHVGSTFKDAMPSGDVSACSAGRGEKAGRVFCPQQGSVHIIYEFQGATPAPEGHVPDAATLATWNVTAMLWDGSEPAP